MIICALYDYKSDTFGHPMTFPNTVEAIRSLDHTVKNVPESTVSKYPEDFAIYSLADYDIKSGAITVHDKPIRIVNASELVPIK